MNDGISLTHPPHFVAQRSRRRGLPLKLESETDLLEAFSNTKSGAGLRADCGSTATRISAACANEHAATQMARVRIGVLILRLRGSYCEGRIVQSWNSQLKLG